MIMKFLHPSLKDRALTLKRFPRSIQNLKIMRLDADIVLGYRTLGVFYCNHFVETYERHVEQRNCFRYEALLEGFKRLEYITKEEYDNEINEVRKLMRILKIRDIRHDISQALDNPEFLDYLKRIKDKIPELLTDEDASIKRFALSLVKLKEVME